MDEQKSSLLIFALSLGLALLLYYYFGSHLTGQHNKQVAPKPQVTANQTETVRKRALLKGENIKVETEKYIAVINTQAGVLKSLKLKEYKDDNGKPMELISPKGFFWNIAKEKDLTETANNLLFSPKVINKKDKVVVVLKGLIDNATVIKKYAFYEKEYRFDLKIEGAPLGISFGPQTAPKDRESKYSFVGPLVYDGQKVKEIKLEKEKSKAFKNPVWVALQSLYFTVTVIPKEPVTAEIEKIGKHKFYIYLLPEKEELFASWGFGGPKKYDLLKSYGLKLEENIRFGIFGVISKPLLYLMNWFYKIIPNYGVAIIFLTIIIKIIFHPLTVKGYKSMNKMKELQPLIQQIRETYKNDPNRMNQEIMELYKKHKVNPFGGCLPMLLQIPVFFALYKLLMVSIELRHAPFILWITDLSAKDPYYITPVLMGVTMLVQQLLTPGQDPSQNKFMLAMPIIFTIIFLNFPSGLCLYFLVSNILSIIEQLLIKHVY